MKSARIRYAHNPTPTGGGCGRRGFANKKKQKKKFLFLFFFFFFVIFFFFFGEANPLAIAACEEAREETAAWDPPDLTPWPSTGQNRHLVIGRELMKYQHARRPEERAYEHAETFRVRSSHPGNRHAQGES